jgi:endogenous inhibitor of DNA gyrase (YacG/DUF329 family)
MAMIRLLDFALLAFVVWLVWSQVIRGWRAASSAGGRGHAPAAPSADDAAHSQEPPAMTLVPCSVCGVHVPSGRTLPGRAGEIFCSETCRVRGARPAS